MKCDVTQSLGLAWVDDELDLSSKLEVEGHLSECAKCRIELDGLRRTRVMVGDGFREVTAPDALKQKLAEQVAQWTKASVAPAPAKRASSRRVVLFAVAAAVPIVLGAGIAGSYLLSPAADATMAARPMMEDVVRRHVAEHPPEIRGEASEVRGWFRNKLSFAARPVRFGSPEVHLVGARLSSVQDRDAAAFYYEWRGHRVTVLAFPSGGPVRLGELQHVDVQGRRLFVTTIRGYSVPAFELDGVAYAMTGDVDSRELIRLAAGSRPTE